VSKERDHIERLTPDLIRRYQAGELSTREQHTVEKYLLENPFEAEALEGLEMISGEEADTHLEALHNRIDQKVNPSEIDKGATEFWVYTRRIAAAILLLLVAGIAYVWLRPALQQTPMSKELTVNDGNKKTILDSASKSKMEEEPVEETADDKLTESTSPQTEAEAAPVQIVEIEADEDVKEDLEFDEALTAQSNEPRAESLLNTDQGFVDIDTAINQKEAQQYQARLRMAEQQANEQRAKMEAQRKSIGLAGTNSRALSFPAPANESKRSSNQSLQYDSLQLNQSQLAAFTAQRKVRSTVNIDSASLKTIVANLSRTDLDNFSISGNVVAKGDGMPLPEVTILGKGTTIGVPTDTNGKFTLQSNVSFDSVVVRYLGYLTQTLPVQNGKTFNIELEPDNQALGEVVVVAKAKQNSSEALAEFTIIQTFDEFASKNLIYPTQALQAGIKGRVVLDVEISPAGKATVLNVVRGLGYGCDEEATRLVEAWTGWEAKVDKKTGKTITSIKRVKVRFKP